MKKFLKRYSFFLLMLAVNLFLLFFYPDTGKNAFSLTFDNILEMLGVVPPIFVMLGLLDVWLKRETMIKYMGKDSKIVGVLLAFVMGTAAAGPLYAAFPVAALLLKKGAKLSNVLIFVGTWSTLKIPMLMFEVSSLGLEFTLVRMACSIVGVLLIAFVTEKLLSKEDQQKIYDLQLTIKK